MAGDLNTLLDHRNRFLKWWDSSMNEMIAYTQLKQLLDNLEAESAPVGTEKQFKADLLQALQTKKLLLSGELVEIDKQAEILLEASARLQLPSISRDDVETERDKIHAATVMIRQSLQMLTTELEADGR